MKKLKLFAFLAAMIVPLAMQAQQSLPISMDFENETAFMQWTMVNCHSSTGLVSSSGDAHEGTGLFKFHWSTNSSQPEQYLITPELVPTTGATEVSFWYKNGGNNYSETFSVGYSSTTSDTASFVWASNVDVPGGTPWTLYSTTVPAGTKYVAIKCIRYDAYYLFVDDIYIGDAPTCLRVASLTASDATTTEITLTWTDTLNSGATYTIYNMADTSVVASGLNGDTYTVTGLTANTSYTFGIEANCTSTDASRILTAVVRTNCVVIASSEMPYHENFSSWTTGSGNLDPCWSDLSYYSTYHPYSNATTGHNGTPDTALYCYAGNNYAPMFAILPDMEDVSGMMVSFYAKGSSADYSTIQVGYMTDPSDSSTFTAIFSTGLMPSVWNYYEAVLPTDNMSNVHNVAFRMHNIYSGYGIFVDDITIAPAPACSRPTALVVRNITSNSAELLIADSTANNNYTVQLVCATTTTISANDTIVTFSGLDVNTPYAVSVVSNCYDGSTTVPITAYFRTSCVTIDGNELPYVMNFDSVPTGLVTDGSLPCWTISNGTSSYPSINSYQSHSGNSLLIYGSSPIEVVALPTFEDDLSTLQLSFWHKAYSNWNNVVAAWVEVGVMSNPSDPSTFTLVQVCQPSTGDWTQFDVSFANFTSGNIAFRYAGTSSYSSVYIDDVTVQALPSCTRPSSVEVSSLSATEATLTINDANNTGVYSVVINNGDSTVVYSNTLYIDTLSANTEYSVRVRTICSNGNPTEGFTTATFRTLCSALSVPFTADFENETTDAVPGCWTNLGGNTNVKSSSYTAHASTKYLDFRGTYRNMIAMPQFTDEISGLQVRFWTRPESTTSSNCGTLHVGYVTDLADTSTFVSVVSYAYNEFTDWAEKEVSMAGAPEGSHIAFIQEANATNYYWYIDDVTVEAIPSCAHPVSVSVSDITIDGATVNVNDPAETDSYYFVLTQDGVGDVDSNFFYSDSYELGNLLPNTAYTVRVATYCGDDTTAFVSTSFRTACTAITSDMLPYTESFESYPLASGIIPCWDYIGNNDTKLSVVATRAHDGNNSYRFGGNASTPHIAILPDFVDGISNLMLNFWFVAENVAQSGNLIVGYVEDDTVFVAVDTLHAADYTTMADAEFTFANAPTGARIAIVQQQATDANYWWWIDDITVGVATACIRPAAVEVRNVATTSAAIWIDDSTLLNDYGVTVISDNDTVQYVNANDTSFSLTNLLPGTLYTVSVRALCGGDSTTAVSTSFYTECENIAALPWIEGFENWATGTAGFSTCWNRFYQGYTASTTNHPYVMAGGHNGSTNALRFYSVYDEEDSYGTSFNYSVAYLPVFDTAVSSLMMNFWFKADEPEYTELYVGVSSSTADTSTFTRLLTIVPVDDQWHEYDLNLSAYTGTGNRITFVQKNVDGETEYDYDYDEYYTYSSSYGYVDDITVDALGTCIRPTSLVVSNVDNTHATLTWTDANSTGDYVVTCSNGDSITVSGALTYTFSNLTPGTNYTVSVRRICGTELTSERSVSFRTATIPVTTLPYTTGFEAGDDQQWDFVQGGGNQWTIGSAAASTGSNSLYISNDNGANRNYDGGSSSVVYASRKFQLVSGEYHVSFDWSALGESNYDFLRVFAMPDSMTLTSGIFGASDYTTGVPAGWQDVVGGKLNLDTNWNQASGTFTVDNAGLYKLVFMWRNDNGVTNNPAAGIDNVSVSADSTVPPPTMYTVSASSADVTMGTATISDTIVEAGTTVTATATANSGYHFVSWIASGSVVSTDNPYTFAVSADIALVANFEADSTEPVECVAPTNVTVTNITSTTATISWEAGGNESRWLVDYNGQSDTTSTNPYTLTGLEPNSVYVVKVKALCDDGNESDWSTPATFNTASVGIDEVNASIALYPNPATTTVTLTGFEGTVDVEIVDMNGRVSGKWRVENGELTVDVSKLARGAYFVRMTGDTHSAVRKLIVN